MVKAAIWRAQARLVKHAVGQTVLLYMSAVPRRLLNQALPLFQTVQTMFGFPVVVTQI